MTSSRGTRPFVLRTLRAVSLVLAVAVASDNSVAQGKPAPARAPQSKPAQPAASSWSLTPLFVIGAEPDTVELGRVQSVQLLRNGRLAIADGSARVIVMTDALGKNAVTIGRAGDGPGEFQSPQSLAAIGDTLAVLDASNSRIGLFNTAGAWQGSWRVQPITGADVRLFRVPGAFYAMGIKLGGTGALTTFIRFDAQGSRDTLAPPATPVVDDAGVMCRSSNGTLTFFSTQYQARYIRTPGPGNTLVDANTSAYKVVQQSMLGQILATFSGATTRVPISAAEWKKDGDKLATYLVRDLASTCDTKTIKRPPFKPAIRAYWWDDAGRLWVERHVAGGFMFDVFSSQGKLLSSMRAPAREPDVEPSVVGDRIAVYVVTPEGVPTVHVFRFGAAR